MSRKREWGNESRTVFFLFIAVPSTEWRRRLVTYKEEKTNTCEEGDEKLATYKYSRTHPYINTPYIRVLSGKTTA